MKTNDILIELEGMMDKWGDPVEAPIDAVFIDSITKRKPDALATPALKKLGDDLCFLLVNQPDYFTFLKAMDGFEYNGLILYSLSVPEPLNKNIFAMNDFYRNNDDFINPDLAQRLVIGNDSISLFTYDTKMNLFEIRDNIATENVFGSFDNFNGFLKEVIDTVK